VRGHRDDGGSAGRGRVLGSRLSAQRRRGHAVRPRLVIVARLRVADRAAGAPARWTARAEGHLVRGHHEDPDLRDHGDQHGTVQERTGADPLVVADFSTVRAQGQTLPGGLQEIVNSSAIYLKMAAFSQETGKEWVEFPASELKTVSGASLSQLLQTNGSNSPLVQTQLLASATNVRKAGTGTVNGVPVTEYTGPCRVGGPGQAPRPACAPSWRRRSSHWA
jgi:hypothetical protein